MKSSSWPALLKTMTIASTRIGRYAAQERITCWPGVKRPGLGLPQPLHFAGTLLLFLDWHANQAAPLRPGAIVVAHFGVAKQIVERKPGMAAALADTAVGHNFFIGSHTSAAIDSAKFIRRFKGAILAHCCS